MTIQVKNSHITNIKNVESDAFLPTESGDFRIAVHLMKEEWNMHCCMWKAFHNL